MERMAKLLDVSTSGYYGWFSRPESGREQERLLLDVLVKAAYEASRGRYGSLKISRAPAEQGRQYRRNRVADSMRRQGPPVEGTSEVRGNHGYEARPEGMPELAEPGL